LLKGEKTLWNSKKKKRKRRENKKKGRKEFEKL